MLCPNCHSANPDDARFCENCGKPMERACPNCGQPASPAAKFCRRCGQPLTTPASPPNQLHQYIPKELLAKLEAARTARPGEKVEGERRVVTMLFCDVKGSTAAAEKLDPEEWAEVMNGAFEHLIAPIYHYEGTLARLMGDAILAFFGAPIAHEDDPQRAVRAGLEIVAGMRAYRDQLLRERGLDLNVRVGLNTGLVVVGEVGSDLRVEYTAMGDAINLAARMEQTAQPGTVQITGDTYKLVAPLFECEALEGIEVKGKAESVPAFQVLGVKAQPGRLRGIEGWETPLVGREAEMAALRRVVAEVIDGRGRIVCLIGEAGLGKSRLLQEARAAWRTMRTAKVELPFGATPSWAESQGASYDTARPYGIFRQIFHNLTATLEADPPTVVRERLNTLLQTDSPERQARVIRVFEILLAVEARAPATGQASLEGEALKRELFEVTLSMIRAWISARPLAMAFDDVHWADHASVELLLHLLQLADEGPILFLCAFRPDRQSAAWQVKQIAERDYAHRYAELRLGPLSPEDSRALVDQLPAMVDLPQPVQQSILERAEGNPLFAEEIARSLMDRGVIVRDEAGWRAAAGVDSEQIVIPTSLQALLMARIDRLEEEARRTLQLASVIGRTFLYRVLQSVSGSQTDQRLRALQKADLIREAARQPELEYAFRHALTHEAAYNSILIKRRKEFHRRAGEALETLMADRLEAYAGLLGHHFYLAGDERALKYYTLAGDVAYRLYANTEAAAHYTRALEMARRAPSAISEAQTWREREGGGVLQRLYSRRGRALELDSRYREALDNYAEMESVARETGDRALELSALLLRATLYSVHSPEHDAARAQGLSKQALALAHELGDGAAEARILWNLLLVSRATGQASEALEHGEQSLAIARRLNLREQMAFTLNDLVGVYWMSREPEKARSAQVEARDLWRELGNLPMLADNLARSTQFHLAAGDYAAVIAASDEAYAISRSIGNVWGQSNSRIGVGVAHWDQGEYGTAIAVQEEAIQLGVQVGHTIALTFIPTVLALVYGAVGAIARGLEVANAALVHARAMAPDWSSLPLITLARLHLLNRNLPATEAAYREAVQNLVEDNLRQVNYVSLLWLSLTEAELALARSKHAHALTLADQLIRDTHLANYRPFIPDALYFKSRVLIAQDQLDLAHQALEEARGEAEAMGSRRSLWPILVALSEVEAQQGESAKAERLRRQAQQIVEYIADHITHPEHASGGPGTPDFYFNLRAAFLHLPDIRALRGT
jgi:class 3 adenylate cyclase/tetratricopeptide (TPR) repeat protein